MNFLFLVCCLLLLQEMGVESCWVKSTCPPSHALTHGLNLRQKTFCLPVLSLSLNAFPLIKLMTSISLYTKTLRYSLNFIFTTFFLSSHTLVNTKLYSLKLLLFGSQHIEFDNICKKALKRASLVNLRYVCRRTRQSHLRNWNLKYFLHFTLRHCSWI